MKIHVLCFSFLLLFLSPSFSSSEKCHPSDKKALLQFKQDLRNPYHLTSWDPNTDCCGWYVVKCDVATNRIVELNLFTANISGQIPPSVGDLPFLETLFIRKITNLTGPIPPTIAKLTRLKTLTLSHTNLTGPVPAFLGRLINLTFLDLSYNKLSGSIPSSLSNLRNLEAIHLEGNKLTGSIPDSMGKFAPGGRVPGLYLARNQLTGVVPRSLGGLKFNALDFSRNRLGGDITFLFGKDKTLERADFSRNAFEFDLTKVEFPSGLWSLELSHNKINGSLPEGLARLDNLRLLNVSYNKLCGRIPSTGGKLSSFDASCYVHNKCLCGDPLQACI